MRILVTNDDGYLANGIQVLADAARRLGEVTVVAPDREQSATSHSLTLHYPLRARVASAVLTETFVAFRAGIRTSVGADGRSGIAAGACSRALTRINAGV